MSCSDNSSINLAKALGACMHILFLATIKKVVKLSETRVCSVMTIKNACEFLSSSFFK